MQCFVCLLFLKHSKPISFKQYKLILKFIKITWGDTHSRVMLDGFEEADTKLQTSFCRPRLPFFKVKGKDKKI